MTKSNKRCTLALWAALLILLSDNRRHSFAAGRKLEDFAYDLSQFSIRFEKCQYVKTFDDEIAADEDSTSPFAVKHFVVYKLCPYNDCTSCNTVYGDYVAEVEEYLASVTERQKRLFEEMCQNCDDECNDDDTESCGECAKTCYQYENLEDNGMVDASEFVECQRLDYEADDDEYGELELYIGPRCTKDGSRIVISLFQDENCWEPYFGKTPEDILGLKLSYHVLSDTYSSGGDCLSCMEDADDEEGNDAEDNDNVNEMCEAIYDKSAKCESRGGLEGGFIEENWEDGNYENQVENEFMVCTFIDSLIFNSYTETGEINIFDEQDEVFRRATKAQVSVLLMLTAAAIGLIGCACHLHRKISSSLPKVEIATSRADGAFA